MKTLPEVSVIGWLYSNWSPFFFKCFWDSKKTRWKWKLNLDSFPHKMKPYVVPAEVKADLFHTNMPFMSFSSKGAICRILILKCNHLNYMLLDYLLMFSFGPNLLVKPYPFKLFVFLYLLIQVEFPEWKNVETYLILVSHIFGTFFKRVTQTST